MQLRNYFELVLDLYVGGYYPRPAEMNEGTNPLINFLMKKQAYIQNLFATMQMCCTCICCCMDTVKGSGCNMLV